MKNGQNKKVENSELQRRIVVAMSGGVDSSVAAALLKKQGYFVMGVFMKFWLDRRSLGVGGKEYNRCCSAESEKLARLVAKKIGIPFFVINVEKEFKKKVVDYFLKEYKKGNTPNPCVVCNKEIKFGLLIEKALKFGADFIATGHYVKTSLNNQIFSRGRSLRVPKAPKNLLLRSVKLLKGEDKEKDQSYFLWQLSQKQLSRVLFPVGNYTKPEVRQLAKKFDLPTAETPESQEVCFISGTTNEFLEKYLKTKPGDIVDKSGKKLGRHQGLYFYTIGQRRGIGLGGSASAKASASVKTTAGQAGETKPYYVVAKDFKKNNLVISKNKKDLEGRELIVKNVNWTCLAEAQKQGRVSVKVRYRAKTAFADVFILSKNKVKIIFDKPQRAITSGQSAVFYKGEELLGGGIIY